MKMVFCTGLEQMESKNFVIHIFLTISCDIVYVCAYICVCVAGWVGMSMIMRYRNHTFFLIIVFVLDPLKL